MLVLAGHRMAREGEMWEEEEEEEELVVVEEVEWGLGRMGGGVGRGVRG